MLVSYGVAKHPGHGNDADLEGEPRNYGQRRSERIRESAPKIEKGESLAFKLAAAEKQRRNGGARSSHRQVKMNTIGPAGGSAVRSGNKINICFVQVLFVLKRGTKV